MKCHSCPRVDPYLTRLCFGEMAYRDLKLYIKSWSRSVGREVELKPRRESLGGGGGV